MLVDCSKRWVRVVARVAFVVVTAYGASVVTAAEPGHIASETCVKSPPASVSERVTLGRLATAKLRDLDSKVETDALCWSSNDYGTLLADFKQDIERIEEYRFIESISVWCDKRPGRWRCYDPHRRRTMRSPGGFDYMVLEAVAANSIPYLVEVVTSLEQLREKNDTPLKPCNPSLSHLTVRINDIFSSDNRLVGARDDHHPGFALAASLGPAGGFIVELPDTVPLDPGQICSSDVQE